VVGPGEELLDPVMSGQGWVERVVVDGVVVDGMVVLEEDTVVALVVAAVTALAPMVAAAMPPAPRIPRVAAPVRTSFLTPNLVISIPPFLDSASSVGRASERAVGRYVPVEQLDLRAGGELADILM
jgi:hypothetical protein